MPNAVCPNAGIYIQHNWIWLFDDISGPTFFWVCVCVKAIPRTACCCQKLIGLTPVFDMKEHSFENYTF